MSALRAIRAVFRASAGLDGEQLAKLHLVRLEVLAVRRLSREYGFDQRPVINVADLFPGPVVTQSVRLHVCDYKRSPSQPGIWYDKNLPWRLEENTSSSFPKRSSTNCSNRK